MAAAPPPAPAETAAHEPVAEATAPPSIRLREPVTPATHHPSVMAPTAPATGGAKPRHRRPASDAGLPVAIPQARETHPPASPPASAIEVTPNGPSTDAVDVVARFIRERMTKASVTFVAPDELARNEPGVAILRLAPATIPPAELEREVREMLGRAGHGDAATILIAPRMVATLTSDQPCVIELRNPPADRAVAFGERTTWEWTVRPTRDTGPSLELAVALAAPVMVDGSETTYSVGVYRKTLAVRVGYSDRAADLLAWLGTSWGTFVAVGSSVGAAAAWLFRSRHRKRQRAGF